MGLMFSLALVVLLCAYLVKGIYIVKQAEESVAIVTVFFDEGITDLTKQNIQARVLEREEVAEVKFAKVRPDAIIPSKRDEDMGFDIYACFDEDYVVINPHETKLIPFAAKDFPCTAG